MGWRTRRFGTGWQGRFVQCLKECKRMQGEVSYFEVIQVADTAVWKF